MHNSHDLYKINSINKLTKLSDHMKWINYFSNSNIPFYIYHLKAGDAIIKITNDRCYINSTIILHGTLYILKFYTNKEKSLVNIVNKNCIINIKNDLTHKNAYYKIIALKETYLLNFSLNTNQHKINNYLNFHINLINSYNNTLIYNELTNQILIHTQIKYRIIQFLLFLSVEFGIVKKNYIKIPFQITKYDIANITGTNRNTINKIIKDLIKNSVINYFNNTLILNKNFIYNYLILVN